MIHNWARVANYARMVAYLHRRLSIELIHLTTPIPPAKGTRQLQQKEAACDIAQESRVHAIGIYND